MKNIAIIGPAWPLRGGGMATFNERMARAFMADGHKVHIYTFSLQYPDFLFPGTTQYSAEAKPSDLSIEALINSVNPLNWIKAGRKIAKANHDIVIVRFWLPLMGPALGTILRIVKKYSKAKIICIADNVIPHEKRPGDKPFTTYFLKPIDAFIVMSQNVLNDLKSFNNRKKVILADHPLYDNFGPSIDKSEARKILNIPTNEYILLFFGFIRKYKGLDILLQAMPKVLEAIPQAKLLIAGEFYSDKEEYENLISNLGLKQHTHLHTHFIRDGEVRNYLCAADLVIQPYRNATQSGVTPLAYHYEVPMVVTNVGGLPDMVSNDISGMVAEPNPSDIANKIIEAYHKPKDYFKSGILQKKQQYSWEKFTNNILELANSIG